MTGHDSSPLLPPLPRTAIRRNRRRRSRIERLRLFSSARTSIGRFAQSFAAQKLIPRPLAGVVAHDVRASLTVLREYASILREGLCGEVNLDQARMLDVMASKTEEMHQWVEDLLGFTELYTGGVKSLRMNCRLQDLTGSVTRVLEKQARFKDLRFVNAIGPDLPPVFCDPDMIARVLTSIGARVIRSSNSPAEIRVWASADPVLREVRVGIDSIVPRHQEKSASASGGELPGNRLPGHPAEQVFGFVMRMASEIIERNFGQLTWKASADDGHRISFDMPLAIPEEVLERYLVQSRRRAKQVDTWMAVRVSCSPCDPRSEATIDRTLSYSIQPDELVMPLGRAEWLLIIPAGFRSRTSVMTRLESIRESMRQMRQVQCTLPETSLEIKGTWTSPASARDYLVQVLPWFSSGSQIW